jgi:hypothetical protein
MQPNHQGIDLLIVQRLQVIARAMDMVLVMVRNGRDRIGCGIDDNERGR